jgi:hypothetical protein
MPTIYISQTQFLAKNFAVVESGISYTQEDLLRMHVIIATCKRENSEKNWNQKHSIQCGALEHRKTARLNKCTISFLNTKTYNSEQLLTDYRPYSKSSLTLTEWRFNLSISWVSMLFLNSWRVRSHIVRYDTNPPTIQKQQLTLKKCSDWTSTHWVWVWVSF